MQLQYHCHAIAVSLPRWCSIIITQHATAVSLPGNCSIIATLVQYYHHAARNCSILLHHFNIVKLLCHYNYNSATAVITLNCDYSHAAAI
ncbi:unnamed protein product [Brugia pahangi]|uniref:Secreted protein n=1 Tax=Brugia pahangi TaxID=6280 RepID=A0A0N4T1Q0_BRUPA|nr:unnamed protein product [Brugia pahangi]